MLPLHPALVHVPLGLAVAVPIVLFVLVVALYRKKASPRAFLVAALLQGVVVAGGLLALASGNADEERVEALVADAAIDRHEALATVFVVAAAVTLAITVAAAFVRERWSRSLGVLGTVASVAVLAVGIAVGHAGASLVYRDGAAAAYAAPGGRVAGGEAARPAPRDED